MLPKAPSFNVKVSRKSIEDAIPRNAHKCMIADSILMCYRGNASYIHVELGSIRFTDLDRGLRFKYFTPKAVALAILQFDMGEKPKPFSFRLRDGIVSRSGSRYRSEASLAKSRKNSRGKKYRRTEKTAIPPQERIFGVCLF